MPFPAVCDPGLLLYFSEWQLPLERKVQSYVPTWLPHACAGQGWLASLLLPRACAKTGWCIISLLIPGKCTEYSRCSKILTAGKGALIRQLCKRKPILARLEMSISVIQHLLANIYNDWYLLAKVSQVALVVKNLPANAIDIRDVGLILGWGRYPGEGHGNALQYSCLENPLDRGAWRATVHGVAKESDTTEVT